MTDLNIRWAPVSETSVMLYFADAIDVSLAPVIEEISRAILVGCRGVREVTPSYTSILVETGGYDLSLQELGDDLLGIARRVVEAGHGASPGKLIELPVYYHPDVGQDLETLAKHANLSIDDVIRIHSGRDYTVCAIGFAPGFAFLAEVDEGISMPRHTTPRSHVPAGSVAIADRQTAVYPCDSPGGWNLIGNCPMPLYDSAADPMCPFSIGDTVRFVPIDRAEYLERGGCV